MHVYYANKTNILELTLCLPPEIEPFRSFLWTGAEIGLLDLGGFGLQAPLLENTSEFTSFKLTCEA